MTVIHRPRPGTSVHVLGLGRIAGSVRALTARTRTVKLQRRLQLLRAEHAQLLQQARAAVAAARRGELDPTCYLAAHLDQHGQLPPAEMSPAELLAQAHECAALVEVVLSQVVSPS